MAHQRLAKRHRKLHRNLNIVILCTIILYGYATSRAGRLTDIKAPSIASQIVEREPEQLATSMPTFNFTYEGERYLVRPQAQYDLYGLIVSQNDTTGIGDIYHNEKSVDLMDICVIWGQNASSEIFHKITFWSEPWTCNFRTKEDSVWDNFNLSQVSNNHLLAGTDLVKKRISSLHIGDQVHLKGMLVDYANADSPNNFRRSSLVRTDTGDGACEVFFVTEATVLSYAPGSWYNIRAFAKWTFFLLVLFKLLYLYKTSQREYQLIKEEGELEWDALKTGEAIRAERKDRL